MKRMIAFTLTAVLLCAALTGCSKKQTSNAQSGDTSYPQNSDVFLPNDTVILPQNNGTEKDVSARMESTSPDESASDSGTEYNFIPVLNEDDIDYMGKPYKDLTADEFIQLWAQCEREYNVQRLYVISYDNNLNADERDKTLIKEFMETNLCYQLNGSMLNGCYDAELHELEDAPEGYYDNEDGELHYCVTYRNIRNIGGMIQEYSDESWITLKKIDGYWKIGIMRNSSPYFFDTSNLYDTADAR